jgi:hypothetical protein
VQIEISGMKNLQRKLERIQDLESLRKPLRDNAEDFREGMTDYPPRRVGQTYIRTLTLGRLWTVSPVRRTWNGLEVAIGNVTPYVKWVQSSLVQAWMHKGRWKTELQVLQEKEEGMRRRMLQHIDKILGG